MKNIYLLLALLIMPALCYAQWSDAKYEQIEKSIKAPTFPNKKYYVNKFGASPQCSPAKNQQAINAAIEKCSKKGGGQVIVPAGTFETGAITLQSGVNLVLEEGATLLFAFEPDLYPVVPTRWEGIDCWNLQPCVYAYQAKDVAITGKGCIDGGGTNDTWWKWCGAPHYGWQPGVISQRNGARARLLKAAEDGVDMDLRRFGPEDGLRPQLINFNQCENILIEGVTLLRSPFWVIHPLLSKNITVRKVHIDNDGPNGDGCDPESCDGVLIEDCTFNTGDDCIAVKSGRNNDGRLWDRPSENIIIRRCDMRNGHGGVVIGSEISGGCRNLFAEDCTMDSPELERVVRIKTNTCRGGVIEDIYARRITVGQCKEAVLKINLDYEHNELCCRGYLPTVRNVTISDITCKKSRYGIDIIALDTCTNVYNINVIDCRFDGVADGNYRTGLVRDVNFKNFYLNGKLCESSSIDDENLPIDRQRVVTRNNPQIHDVDTLASLTVGNGHFAATVDVTGLQTFFDTYANGIPLCTMSDWGWHSFPNVDGLTPEESQKIFNLHSRESAYAVEYKEEGRGKKATEYFRVNPHRLNLATVGLILHDPSTGKEIKDPSAIHQIDQELKLWDGMIESKFVCGDQSYEVSTGVIPTSNCLYSRICGDADVRITFPYPTGAHSDGASSKHPTDVAETAVVKAGDNFAVLRRTLGTSTYYAYVQWEGMAEIKQGGTDEFVLSSTDPAENSCLSFAIEYSLDMPKTDGTPYAYDQARKQTMKHWASFWKKGAIVDFGLCTDPRAPELERRTVLSQYLTAVNCSGTTPPQETGLTYNSWFGRPHLEMTWWHAVDFALWNRPEVIERFLEWYNTSAITEARALAQRQNFKGVRWLKMTDPWSGEAPSNVGSFLIWQQPHYIYLAEEMYRANPTAETLSKYAAGVEATAEFMLDYASVCAKDGPIKLHGQTAMQESMSKDFSFNHPYEQAYWRYGLETAQRWRERQGLPRNPEYDGVIARMAPLTPNADGIYTAGDRLPNAKISAQDFALKSRSDHPAVLGACGLLPDTGLYDRDTMLATLQWVMDNWNWDTTWGWDYGMIAMAAARLGAPETAVDALLIDKGKNTYLPNGHNYQEPRRLRLYLPGNGALLTAIAMMCAGWDGTETPNPGFPTDGSWRVRWEGLQKMQ